MPSLPARPAVRPAGMPTLPARPPKPANGTGPSGVSLFQYSCNILQDAFVYCYAIFKNDYGMLYSHGRQHKVSFLLYVWICKQYLVGPDRVHASLCRCSSSEQLQCWAQSAATEAKPEEQSGASGTRVPVSGAQSQTRQQGVAASTPQGNGLPNGTSPSAPSTTGNGPAHGGPVSAARTAGTVSSGGAGGNSSGGAHLSRTSL